MIDAQAQEARRAIYKANMSWRALRNAMQHLPANVPGFSDPRELRASMLAQRITNDGYLAGYIANRLLEGN